MSKRPRHFVVVDPVARCVVQTMTTNVEHPSCEDGHVCIETDERYGTKELMVATDGSLRRRSDDAIIAKG